MSLLFEFAALKTKEMHAEWEAVLEVSYTAADNECNGNLLNRLGKAEQVSAYSLFKGSAQRAFKYASHELVEYWAEVPRYSKVQFERDFMDSQGISF